MPALLPTRFYGRITFLGRVLAEPAILASQSESRLFASFAGVEGEVHSGLTRAACSRVTDQYKKGTTIANTRQFSVLSAEELAQIAAKMGITTLDPCLLGASMVVEGIPDFTHIPPGSRLQGPSGASLVVDMENRPCVLPSKGIDEVHEGHGKGFKQAAKGRRGVIAWAEAEGWFALGEPLRLHIPDQPEWAGKALL